MLYHTYMTTLPAKDTRPVAVIMAGGEGKRLWPFSTEEKPKQLNTTFSEKTLLTETYEHICQIFDPDRVIVITTEILADETKKHVTIPKRNLVVQPKNMDTAVAVCLAALHLEALFPESTAVFLQSDQRILEPKRFLQDIKRAERVARSTEEPVLIGTSPLTPNTQFGYIQLGKPVDERGCYEVMSFREKPDQKTAMSFIKSGRYVWNTGIKVWKTASLLAAIKQQMPDAYQKLLELRAEIGGAQYYALLEKWFHSLPKTASFEELVSQQLKEMLVYVADYRWEDMGNWEVFYQLADKDSSGNAIVNQLASQKVTLVDTHNCLVLPRQGHIGIIGLDNIIVVQSEDGLLICRRDMAGDVKKLLE